MEPVAIVYFHNHHWMMANTDMFKCLVQKGCPNLPHQQIDNVIRYLSNQDRSTSYYVETQRAVKFRCWKNQIPFRNGILDFNYVRNIIDEIDKRKASRDKNTNKHRMFELTLASNRDAIRTNRAQSVAARLKNDTSLLDRLNMEFNTPIDSSHLDVFSNFSVFRNYTDTDAVLNVLDKSLSIDDYILGFDSTYLLSLKNYNRYSEEFCTYIQCLFGNSASEGLMGPFQYVRLLVTFVFLAQSMLRNKVFQASLNLVGNGSNGKSQFMEFLKNILGDKMVYITTKSFFNTTGETRQMSMIDEEVFLVYDVEANDVDGSGFKTFVTDTVPQLCRKLYKSLDRNRKNFASVVMCSNTPIRYMSSSSTSLYDEAFHRRVIVLPLYNVLGKKKRKSLMEQDLSADIESEPPAPTSLFAKKNFDIKDEQTIQCIQRGLFLYILDVMHVLELAALSATSNDYMLPSMANQRLLGAANNPFARVLFDKYCFLDQIYTYPNDIINCQSQVDLATFFYENMNVNKLCGISLDSVCGFLESCFGVIITKQTSDLSVSDISNQQQQRVVNPWAGDVGKYIASGLIPKNKLSLEQVFRRPILDLFEDPFWIFFLIDPFWIFFLNKFAFLPGKRAKIT